MKRTFLFAILEIMVFTSSKGQNLIDLNSPLYDEFRFEELNDTTKRSSLFYGLAWREMDRFQDGSTKEIQALPISFNSYYNSKYPRDFNNGAVWTGKGMSSSISAGVSYKSRNLEITFFPVIWFAQNADFELESLTYLDTINNFRYPYSSQIDFPQRLGDESHIEFNLGQSRIKYVWNDKLYMKFSTENMWWGPSYTNSIMMSNTASGFPHFSVGSENLLPIKIGDLGFSVLWGRLQNSDYFGEDNLESKLFNAINIEYQPSFIDGLELGISRVGYTRWVDLNIADFFKVFTSFDPPSDTSLGPKVNDDYDQIMSLFIRWRFPEIGFEAYYEYVRNDFGGDLQNLLIANPDHSRFYTFGFAKIAPTKIGDLRFLAEFNTLSRSNSRLLGPSPSLYQHPFAEGGYTHLGQLVGAPIGTGSNSQYFSASLQTSSVTYKIIINRIGYNDDYYFDNAIDEELARDVEMNGGLGTVFYTKDYLIGIDLMVNDRDNWYYSRKATNFYFNVNFIKVF